MQVPVLSKHHKNLLQLVLWGGGGVTAITPIYILPIKVINNPTTDV